MTPTPTVTKLAQKIADNSALIGQMQSEQQVQMLTRQRARSSSQQVRTIREQVDSMEEFGRQNRRQKRSSTPNAASVTTVDSEERELSPTNNPTPAERGESLPLQIWNEQFGDEDFNKVVEQSDYLRNRVAGLLEDDQIDKVASATTEELRRRKESFGQLQGYDAKDLREKFRKLFTSIVMKRVKFELAERKEAIEHKLEDLEANLRSRAEHRAVLNEKHSITTIQVEKAHTALNDLLTMSTEFLDKETEASSAPGEVAATVKLMVNFISDALQNDRIALPAV